MTARLPIRRGFSLLEVLATMAIGSSLLVVAVTMLTQAGRGYERNSGNVAAEREARAVLSQAADDLAKAVWHAETVMESDGDGWKRSRLGFLSLQPPDAQSEDGRSGDVCAVHYYIKDIEAGSVTVRCLMRGFQESGRVFPALRSGEVSALFQEGEMDEPVAFGVLSFEVEPLTRSKSGSWEAWHRGAQTSSGPDALRLRLIIARRELLGKLTRVTDWDNSPLRGLPSKAANNPDLEIYEMIQRFGNHD